jgi:hypothetical protein
LLEVATRPADLEHDVLALDVSEFAQPPHERIDKKSARLGPGRSQHRDASRLRCLCLGTQRRGKGMHAQQRNRRVATRDHRIASSAPSIHQSILSSMN